MTDLDIKYVLETILDLIENDLLEIENLWEWNHKVVSNDKYINKISKIREYLKSIKEGE